MAGAMDDDVDTAGVDVVDDVDDVEALDVDVLVGDAVVVDVFQT